MTSADKIVPSMSYRAKAWRKNAWTSCFPHVHRPSSWTTATSSVSRLVNWWTSLCFTASFKAFRTPAIFERSKLASDFAKPLKVLSHDSCNSLANPAAQNEISPHHQWQAEITSDPLDNGLLRCPR